jgi:hypothetical protein
MKFAMPRVLVVAVVTLSGAGVTFANEPQFGQWAADPQSCSGAASLTVTATTLQRSGESCTIGKMYKADRALYIEGRCTSGGIMARHPITLQMKGERLAVTWNGERLQEMQRCR